MTLGYRNFCILEFIIYIFLIHYGCASGFQQFFSDAVETIQGFACKHLSCCEFHLNQKESWLNGDKHLLELLDEKLYGQHLAKHMIFEAVSKHMIKPTAREVILKIVLGHKEKYTDYSTFKDHRKELTERLKENSEPLRILMYGPTGTGKNYASQLIAETIYKQGLKSPLVHVFAGKATFPVQRDAVHYASNLKQWLQGNTSKCSYSMFIFDEFDHWPRSLIEMTKSLSASGDFRNAIFIYIINSGGSEVVEALLELYESGMIREDIELNHIQKSPEENAACKSLDCLSPWSGKQNSLLYHAYLALTNLLSYFKKNDESNEDSAIDYVIPFLPLEEKHVRSCIVDHFLDKGCIYPSEKLIKAVLSGIKFGPEGKEVFSILGCKRIHSLVINALATQHRRWTREEL